MPAEQPEGATSHELLLQPGDTLIHEGALGDTAYCILDGEVQVWKRSAAGPVELARLGAGSIFGEMSLVDEKPRSASITALTATRLKEVKREQFLDSFQRDPEFATALLRVLFERLRETDARLTQIKVVDNEADTEVRARSDHASHTPSLSKEDCKSMGLTLELEGLTDVARQALPSNPYTITHVPFRIGRQSSDRLAYNDLAIPDLAPHQISVNHLLIFVQHNCDQRKAEVGIFDRGSSLGSRLNGQPLGGLMASENATFLPTGDSELVLGDEDSLFKFRINLAWT